jgi:hypothetical protein
MGDPAIEELFVLAADAGVKNLRAVIAPHDLRVRRATLSPTPDRSWLAELYAMLDEELRRFPR